MTTHRGVMQYASLGHHLRDKATLGLYRLISGSANSSRNREIGKIAKRSPMMWLRPSLLNGMRLLIDPTDASQTVIFDEIFLQESYDLSKVPFTPETIIDCGAHIGMFLLLAAVRFPHSRLIGYEPNPKNAALVQKQLWRNSLDVEFHQAAVSAAHGTARFVAINSHGGRLSGANQGPIPSSGFDEYIVEVLDLQAEIERIRPNALLLKMDIEGEERDVLPAIMQALPCKTALFFETHFGDAGWLEIQKLLNIHGFGVEQINSRGLYCDGFAFRA